MAAGFDSTTLSLGQLLSDPNLLRVPDFQRPYSWTISEAEHLLDDIIVSISDPHDGGQREGYFLGLVLLLKGADAPEPKQSRQFLDIIDGQQRLATATIILASIRDIARDRNLGLAARLGDYIWSEPEGQTRQPRLTMRTSIEGFFTTFVQDPGASERMPETDELPRGEQLILRVREHMVEALHDYADAELEALADGILHACYLSVVVTHCLDSAHRIFSVMNTRGRPLARNDILKAQLFGAMPASSRAPRIAKWDSLQAQLRDEFESLFSYLRSAEGQGHTRVISGIHDLIAKSGGAEAFFDELLVPYGEILLQLTGRGESQSDSAVAHLASHLRRLPFSEWVAPALLQWHRCQGDPARVESFLRRLDRFAYGIKLLGLGGDKRLSRFSAILSNLRNGIDVELMPGPLDLTREELRNIQYNLRHLHARSQLACKLVLLRLNDVIAGAPAEIDPAHYTVEHVLPQKPGRNSEWMQWFPNQDERQRCMSSLGNLILVSRADNERARNLPLARKLEIYFADGEDKALALTREIAGRSEWRAADVKAREERLLRLINGLWEFEPPKGADSADLAGGGGAQNRKRRKKPVTDPDTDPASNDNAA